MNILETLLDRRWILKSKEKDLYYKIKDELPAIKRFLTEKLGYQVIINPYLIKLEKLPAVPQKWMGILEFSDKIEYTFLCLILMFLEDKETEEQFVLSELTEYIQSHYQEESIDWTLYHYRRHLVKVIKFCIVNGMMETNDGTEEGFARDNTNEVLYENTGVSRYFMRNFTQNIMNYQSPIEFQKEEWIDLEEDRGIVRRQRVYRQLLMSPAMYKTEDSEEDFAYIRHYRNLIQGDLEEMLDCELQVHRTSAFLILGEHCGMGRCFPEENTISDISLLISQIIHEKVNNGELCIPPDERLKIPSEKFQNIVEQCKERFGAGMIKTYREMTTGEFIKTIKNYMIQLELIEEHKEDIWVNPILGKLTGSYPSDFVIEKKKG